MATELLEEAIASTKPILARVRSDQLLAATPCASWDVRGVINHLVSATHFGASVMEGASPAWSEDDFASGDFVAAYDEAASRVVAAFSRPGALEEDVDLQFAVLPGTVFFGIVSTDQFVHGWDLATATGQSRDLDRALAATLLERARGSVPSSLRGADGEAPFGPEQAAPAGAPPADQLAAFLGRSV